MTEQTEEQLSKAMAARTKATIVAGSKAWTRLKTDHSWYDWLQVGEALMIGRNEAMLKANTNAPVGGAYNRLFGEWLAKYGFAEIDKGDRSRLIEVMEHQAEIAQWRATLTRTERLRLNHPSSVLRRWRKETKEPKEKKEPADAFANHTREEPEGAELERLREVIEENAMCDDGAVNARNIVRQLKALGYSRMDIAAIIAVTIENLQRLVDAA